MPGLQEIIHKFDVGEGTRIIKGFAAAMLVLAMVVVYDLREYKNFATSEAMDVAQVARHLAEGKGFTTDCIRPFSLFLVQKHRVDSDPLIRENHPDLANAPLYPLLLAGYMKVAPFNYTIARGAWRFQPEVLIALFNQFWFFLAIGLVFRLAKRLFDAQVAWFSAAMMFFSDLFWRFSVSGLSTMVLLVIFLAVVWCLVRLEQAMRAELAPAAPAQAETEPSNNGPAAALPEPPRSALWFLVWSALAGILVGLGGLTRYSFAFLIVPVAVYIGFFCGRHKITAVTAVLAAFLCVMTPWLVRNFQVSGTFFGTAQYAICQDTPKLPGTVLERSLHPDFQRQQYVEVDDYLRKLMINASQIVQQELPRLGGNWLSAFFLVGLLMSFRNPTLSRLRFFLIAGLALMLVVQGLGRTRLTAESPDINSENLLVLFAPLILIYGAGLVINLVDQMESPIIPVRNLIMAAIGLVACLPIIFTLLPPRSYPVIYPPYYPPLIQQLGGHFKPNELIMSDMPWAMAWYGNRKSVWLTLDYKDDFFAINDKLKPINGLYVTQLTMDQPFLSKLVKGDDRMWGRFVLECLLTSKIPTGFPLKSALSDVLPDQVFLADWERWRIPGKTGTKTE